MCMSAGKRPTSFGDTTTGIHFLPDDEQVQFYGNTVRNPSGQFRTLGRRSRSADDDDQLLGGDSDALPSALQTDDELPEAFDTSDTDESTGNALVMPFLTSSFDSIQLVDTTSCPDLLKAIKKAVQPPQRKTRRRRSDSDRTLGGADSVVIEEFDIYTIVRAESALAIFDAIQSVEARKRPDLNEELMAKLDEWYGCSWAVCCFDEREEGEALPIAYRYKAKYPEIGVIYTMDGHDGKVPDVNAKVKLDHAVFAGSYKLDVSSKGKEVRYQSDRSAALRDYSPNRVVGTAFPKGTQLVNGDIMVKRAEVERGIWNPYRVTPVLMKGRKPIKMNEQKRSRRRSS